MADAYEKRARAALQAFMDANGLNPFGWARASNIGDGTVRSYLDGRSRSMSDRTYNKLAQGAAKLLKRPVAAAELRGETHLSSEDIAHGLAEDAAAFEPPASKVVDVDGEAYASLVRWDLRLSAGAGALAPATPVAVGRILFRLEWIKRVTSTPIDSLVVLDVDGDSMEPTLRHGDNVLLDLRQVSPKRKDGLYALNRDGELQVKRVAAHPVSGLLTIISDNPNYPTWKDIPPDDVSVFGRVIWMGRAL